MPLITMPKTTWYWLDDLVHQKDFPYNGYKALIAEFAGSAACPATLVQTLERRWPANMAIPVCPPSTTCPTTTAWLARNAQKRAVT